MTVVAEPLGDDRGGSREVACWKGDAPAGKLLFEIDPGHLREFLPSAFGKDLHL